jgi:hypothetical protein
MNGFIKSTQALFSLPKALQPMDKLQNVVKRKKKIREMGGEHFSPSDLASLPK